jgi:hypothetical protein
MSNPADEAALARVPDLPQWVDTRGMLLTGRAVVTFPVSSRFETDGFVVELAARAVLAANTASLSAARKTGVRGNRRLEVFAKR